MKPKYEQNGSVTAHCPGCDGAVTNFVTTAHDRTLGFVSVTSNHQYAGQGYPKADTRAHLIKEIRRLRRKVRAADEILRPFIEAFSAALDGFDHRQMEEEIKALFS